MKLTFDKFASWLLFAFLSGFGFIFFNMWQSVDKLNINIAVIVDQVQRHDKLFDAHESRLRELERNNKQRE
jgi:hypothetical protein